MDIGSLLAREIAMRMQGERPAGWGSDPRGDFFWESQILAELMGEYQNDPDAQKFLTQRLDELKEKRYEMPIPEPTAKPPSVMRGGRTDG